MSDDTLRDEILGDDGFANWLRGKRLSGKALAERAQARIQDELGAVSCANVNDYLCRLLDAEYEIYLETERELIEGAVEAFLAADDTTQSKYPALRSPLEALQGHLAANREPCEALIAVSKSLAQFYKLLTESFAQSRKTRAGGSAQYHVAFILNQLAIRACTSVSARSTARLTSCSPALRCGRRIGDAVSCYRSSAPCGSGTSKCSRNSPPRAG